MESLIYVNGFVILEDVVLSLRSLITSWLNKFLCYVFMVKIKTLKGFGNDNVSSYFPELAIPVVGTVRTMMVLLPLLRNLLCMTFQGNYRCAYSWSYLTKQNRRVLLSVYV